MTSSGIENNPTVFYRLIRGSTAQTNKYDTFYLQQRSDNGHTWADIKVNHPLDYENIKEYNLTIRVEVTIDIKSLISYCSSHVTFLVLFAYCRIMECSSWPVKQQFTSCWRMSTMTFPCLLNVSRRRCWRVSLSEPVSLGSTPLTRTAHSRTIR